MSVYEVHAPDRDAARAIALRLYASLRTGHDWGQRFDDTPAEAVLERMSELAPREMRRAWTAAFGNARLDGRDAIEARDLPEPQHAGKRGPLGFVSH
jgi:ATP-dependent Lon protease